MQPWINTSISKLNFIDESTGVNLSLFGKCSKLVSLQIEGHTLSVDKSFTLPTLKCLTLSILKLNGGLTGLPNLEYLSITNCSKMVDLNYLTHLPSLTYLDLSSNRGLIDIDGLRGCPLLKKLLLTTCPFLITHPDWELHNLNIQELSFPVTNISQVNIANLPQLTRLTLWMLGDLVTPLVSTTLTGLMVDSHNNMNSMLKMPDLSFLPNLTELYFHGSSFYRKFTFPKLPLLQLLSFYYCNSQSIDISNLNLNTFIVKYDLSLNSIIGLEKNMHLESITIESCKYIETLLIGSKPKLRILQIEKCMKFKKLLLLDCHNLEIFTLHQLPIQVDITSVSTTHILRKLTITECRKLQTKIRLSLTNVDTTIMFSPGVQLSK